MLQDYVNKVFDRYPDGDDGPRMHPLVYYVGKLWDDAENAGKVIDLDAINLTKVLELCESGEEEHPSWNSQLNLKSLQMLLYMQPHGSRWWLPPIQGEDGDTGE
jgi:hypothetical protein